MKAVVRAKHFPGSHDDERGKHRAPIEALEGGRDVVAIDVLEAVRVPLTERDGEVEPGPGLTAGVHTEIAVKVVA